MYLLDFENHIIDSEISLDVFKGVPCLVVESSGGGNRSKGLKRRNPDYNKLLETICRRFATLGVNITNILLDSHKVRHLPDAQRTILLERPYPFSPAEFEPTAFRLMVQRQVATMHRASSAEGRGNSQRRLCICIDRKLSLDELGTLDEVQSEALFNAEFYSLNVSETEREVLRLARIGQGQFRTDVLSDWHGECPITWIRIPELLVASHIKPWAVSTNQERIDPGNGILLSALFDKFFDRGLITFSSLGEMLVSSLLSDADRLCCGIRPAITIDIAGKSKEYLEFHRVFRFCG